MVVPERIDIEPFIFILISKIKSKYYWLLSVNGVGSCGSSISKSEAIEYISNSSRLSENQRSILLNNKKSNELIQLELF